MDILIIELLDEDACDAKLVQRPSTGFWRSSVPRTWSCAEKMVMVPSGDEAAIVVVPRPTAM